MNVKKPTPVEAKMLWKILWKLKMETFKTNKFFQIFEETGANKICSYLPLDLVISSWLYLFIKTF